MTTQGRRGGSRRRRSSDTQAVASAAAPAVIEPAAALTAEPEVELLEDTTVPFTGTRRGGSLGRSMTGAVVGAFLVVGLAFGAAGPGGALGPKSDGPAAANESSPEGIMGAGSVTTAQHGGYDDGDESEATAKPEYDYPDATAKPDGDEGGDGGDSEKPEATAKPDKPNKPEKPEKPDKEKPDKPDPDKEPTEHIKLELAIKDDHPLVEWGSCAGLNFDYYKVVRSTNSTVSWPGGDGDELIAAVEPGGQRKAWDKHAPHGVKVWYRVFCVRKSDDGYKVVNSSATERIWVPAEQEPPDPITLELEATVNGEGEVALDWSKCDCEDFGFYKVVRSTTNDNPSYYPWTDGTEVIGVIEDKYETDMVDTGLEPGETAYYRVQCLGWVNGEKVLLGQSAVVEVTVP